MSLPYPVPVGRTARRLEWAHLPPTVRRDVERRIGGFVVEAHSQDSGFTPGFASVLVTESGTRHFVKAASSTAQRMFAESYREEGRKLAALPPGVPAPRLQWVADDGEWVVLGIEHVAGRAPHRPWTQTDLTAALDALARTAALLTPPPDGVAFDDFAEEFAGFPAYWTHVIGHHGLARAADAAGLAADFVAHTRGSTLVHTDIRDDNLIVTDAGVLVCDWNWPVVGAAWIDSLLLLIGPRGDGLDVEAVISSHPTFTGVDPDAIDSLLALVTGYFLKCADDPTPTNSPYIREHQRWQGDVVWDWLCQRRGWDPR